MKRIGAGFRYSAYGIRTDPGIHYWLDVAEKMTAKFPGASPECIWIAGILCGRGTHLNFPAETVDPWVKSMPNDVNEAILDRFDRQGFKVWLQVEPGDADVAGLIDLVLNRYGHHPCVAGFGVDVEWVHSDGRPEGTPISDKEAHQWVIKVREHNPQYRLFLKHWDVRWMPPTHREGLVFVDDSQQFKDREHLLRTFVKWGKHFDPAPVAFQFGYPADKRWWGQLADPPGEIGQAILEHIPNTTALYWVDFSLREVFPPEP